MMKKSYYIVILISFLFLGCNSDDDVNSDAILVKKAVSGSSIFEYKYNGNKISKLTTIGVEQLYTYTGGLITNIKRYYAGSTQLEFETKLTYDSNERLIEEVILFYPDYSGSKIVYTYNTNGTISFQTYTGNFTSQNTLLEIGNTYINAEGNITKVETYRGADLNRKIEYTYDNKSHIFKNIIGYGKLNSNFEGNKNNLISKRVYDGSGTLVSGFNCVYTYNSDNFPSSVTTEIIGISSTSTTEYFY